MRKERGIGAGALVGVAVTVPLVAVFFLAEQVAGLPFVPFEWFDWLARVLPGGLITTGIDSMVALIAGLNLGETSSTAKTLEGLAAVGFFLLMGATAGALFFVILRTRSVRLSSSAGLVLGLAVGMGMLLISANVGLTSDPDPIISSVWILAAFLVWGAAIGWAYNSLTLPMFNRSRPAPQAAPTPEIRAVETSVAVQPIDRRRFMIQLGAATAVITVIGVGLGGLVGGRRRAQVTVSPPPEETGDATLPRTLPGAGPGLVPAPGTRPEITPLADHFRIDISLRAPEIDGAAWTLPVTGLVDHPLNLTLDDLRSRYESMDQYVTLSCISNPVAGDLIGTQLWTGVSLRHILADAGLQEDAAYLRIMAADGFYETVSIDLIESDERIMVCYAWDNQPLTVDHGFPLRIYIPDRYGMKQPKWITSIEVIADYEGGYWVLRGWDAVARVRTTSVIDTVAGSALIAVGGQLLVPIGGIAHAGARGISKVEVQVDAGEWQEARLRSPLSETTWVIWRYDWPFAEGGHTFTVRCYEDDGTIQDDTPRPPSPSGASGLHTRRVNQVPPVEQGTATPQ